MRKNRRQSAFAHPHYDISENELLGQVKNSTCTMILLLVSEVIRVLQKLVATVQIIQQFISNQWRPWTVLLCCELLASNPTLRGGRAAVVWNKDMKDLHI